MLRNKIIPFLLTAALLGSGLSVTAAEIDTSGEIRYRKIEPVTNRSLTTNVILTNDNIYNKANEGDYSDGLLKFFIITKTAVIDCPHSGRDLEGSEHPYEVCVYPYINNANTLYFNNFNNQPGDHLETCKTLPSTNLTDTINYPKDHDVFKYSPSTTKSYTIQGYVTALLSHDTNMSSDLTVKVYNNTGFEMTYSNGDSNPMKVLTLLAGNTYYIDVFNQGQLSLKYNLRIT